MKKKIFRILIWIVSSIALMALVYFVLLEIHPKNARRVPIYMVLLYLDIFLWFAAWKFLAKKHYPVKILSAILYWLPLAVSIVTALVSLYKPSYHWSDFWRIYPGGIIFSAYLAKTIPFIFLLISYLLKSFRFIAKKRDSERSSSRQVILYRLPHILNNAGWITGGIFFILLMLGIFVFSGKFELTRQPVFLKELPGSFEGYKIIQISDMHLGSWHSAENLEKAVKMINRENADIVVFTGDLVNFVAAEAIPFKPVLSEIKAKHGIYCVLGNHDYGDYVKWNDPDGKKANMTQLFDFYKSIGWTLLLNENHLLKNGNDSIVLIGVENWGRLARFPKKADMNSALKGVEEVPVKILLSHDPTHFEDVVIQNYKDIDLTLSGHVHGFQIGLKFGDWKFSLAQYTYKFWDGFYEVEHSPVEKQVLYVNRGVGSLLYPGRLGMPPEITVIELKQSSRL